MNTTKAEITEVKDFAFSTFNRCGYILHDNNRIAVINYWTRKIIAETHLDEFSEEIEHIYFKDFNEGTKRTNELDESPEGTLILTAENNTVLYTAEIYYINKALMIDMNRQIVFKRDKTPKLLKFVESSNFLFLINQVMPYKLYAVKIEAINNTGKLLEMQAINKTFSYIYETTLSFTEKLNCPLDFD